LLAWLVLYPLSGSSSAADETDLQMRPAVHRGKLVAL